MPINERFLERHFLTRMTKLLCILRWLRNKVLCINIRSLLSLNKKIPKHKYALLCFLITSACILPVHGQDSTCCTPACTIYFRFDKTAIDSTYSNNRDKLRIFHALFSDSTRVSLIDSIHIYAYSSPEGRQAYNETLAVRRASAMKEYLLSTYPFLEHCSINSFPKGENWEGLRELIVNDDNFPEREEVLMILDKVEDSDKRERLIKRLNGGSAFRYIQKNILPLLRNAMVCTVWVDDRLREKVSIPLSAELSTPLSRGVGVCSYAPTDIIRLDALTHPLPPLKRGVKRNYSALKTNLATWAASCINLAYETQIGKHFSIDIPLMWSSWDISKSHALRIIGTQPEFRYWLTTPGRGHFFGLHAHAARYNLKWNDTRYQDTNRPLLGGGISYGYLLPFNETWGMEFNIGAGYANTRYNLYHNTNNGACFDTRTLNYWGITRIGLSFIYKLPQP